MLDALAGSDDAYRAISKIRWAVGPGPARGAAMNPAVVEFAHYLASAITVLFGLWCLLRPRRVASAVSFELRGARGRAEFRIGFGGFMIGIAAYALWAGEPLAFKALGAMWLGGAVARVLVWFADQPVLERSYLGVFVFELTQAALLLC